jgi:triacylglycerol lipase
MHHNVAAVRNQSVIPLATLGHQPTSFPPSPFRYSATCQLLKLFPITMLLIHRTALRRRGFTGVVSQLRCLQEFHAPSTRHQRAQDPRLKELGNVFQNEFAAIRTQYEAPRNPIILAHGLLGFDELRLVPNQLIPGIHYWRGITEALAAKDVEVITASVPPSGSIEKRAEKLGEIIAQKAQGKAVNIIA